MVGRLDDFSVKDHRVKHFNDSLWTVGAFGELKVGIICDIAGGEDPRTALAAEQDHAFVSNREAAQHFGASERTISVALNAIEEPHIYRIETAIKGDLFDVDLYEQEFSLAGLDGRIGVSVDVLL